MDAPWVLVPALRPEESLVDLVGQLVDAEVRVLVVDDGSGDDPVHRARFHRCADAGAVVLVHEQNRGKGQALRTGLHWLATRVPDAGVVTADADGQHTVPDILAVRRRVAELPDGARALVLGVRDTCGADVPLRSRLGNRASALVLALAAGDSPSDTQTGLRGIPAGLVAWAARGRGDRYDFEYRQLLWAVRDGVALVEVPVTTVYEAGNPTSHFRPVRDSLQVLAPALVPAVAFTLSGVGSFVLDTLLFLSLLASWGGVVPALLAARTVSGAANFLLNRRLAFRGARTPLRRSAIRYAALSVAVLVAGLVLLQCLLALGLAAWGAKLVTDSTLFVVSYVVQRVLVFRPPRWRQDLAPRAASSAVPLVQNPASPGVP